MEQFIKLNTKLIEQFDINITDNYVYSLIYDRMRSSIKREQFFDKKIKNHYVIFANKELAALTKLSIHKISNIIQKLIKVGLIITKRQNNLPNKIFVPYFDGNSYYENPEIHIMKTNQNNINQKHNNTVNTKNIDNKYQEESKLTQWIQSTNSVIGLTLSTLKKIKSFSKNKIDDCKHIVRVILNARNSVANENLVSKTAVTQFESNKKLQDDLGNQLDHIFSYIKKHGYTNYYGYLTNALKDYFKIAFGLAEPTKIVKPRGQNVQFNDHEHFKEELPEWAKNDKIAKMTPQEREERNKRLFEEQNTMKSEKKDSRRAELDAKLDRIRSKMA